MKADRTPKIICLLAAAVFLFSGCSALQENNRISDLPELEQNAQQDMRTSETIRPSLYFYDSSAGKLSAEVREIELSFEEDAEEVVVKEILKGPKGEGLSAVAQDVTLDMIEVFDDCVNVYLDTSRAFSDEARFTMAVAVSDTMIDFTGKAYVSIFVNGEALSVGGRVCGPLTKSDGNVTALYNQYYAKFAHEYDNVTGDREMNVVLYFPDRSGTYLRSEVRSVTFSPADNVIDKLIKELAEGPSYTYYLKPYLSKEKLAATEQSIIYNETIGQYSLMYDDDIFMDDVSHSKALEVAGIYYTIAGMMPNCYRTVIESGTMFRMVTRRVAKEHLGGEIMLSLPDEKGSSLKSVSRTVQVSESGKMSSYIKELMRGPVSADRDEGIASAFPDGITISDLLGVTRVGSTAVVNLSQNFYEVASRMDDWKQKLMVFSMVNTLTNISGIKTVRFLIDGKAAKDLGGSVNIESELMPNTGLQG